MQSFLSVAWHNENNQKTVHLRNFELYYPRIFNNPSISNKFQLVWCFSYDCAPFKTNFFFLIPLYTSYMRCTSSTTPRGETSMSKSWKWKSSLVVLFKLMIGAFISRTLVVNLLIVSQGLWLTVKFSESVFARECPPIDRWPHALCATLI